MTKIHIIGNSHTAAIKDALNNGNVAVGDIEVTFFALKQELFRHAHLQPNGRFGIKGTVANRGPKRDSKVLKINGALDTDLSESQAIIRIGVNWGIAALAEIISCYAIPGISDNDLPHKMTRPAFDAMCRALAETTLPDPALLKIGKKIVTVLQPIPSETCLQHDKFLQPEPVQLQRALKVISDTRPAFDALIAQIKAAHLENDCTVIEPPLSTRGKTGLTKSKYSHNARNLVSDSFRSDDVLHMNADYAGLVWDIILEHVND